MIIANQNYSNQFFEFYGISSNEEHLNIILQIGILQIGILQIGILQIGI